MENYDTNSIIAIVITFVATIYFGAKFVVNRNKKKTDSQTQTTSGASTSIPSGRDSNIKDTDIK